MADDLVGRIAARSRRFGPLKWSDYLDAALYDPDGGFYQAGGRAGRRGDFVTSPELGPLFAAVVARALDRCWDELGRPDPYVVVEAGAGVGTLARDVLASAPACAGALRYVLVERSAALRAEQAQRLPLEHPAHVLGPVAAATDLDDGDGRHPLPGRGPLVSSLAELPAEPIEGVVLANELLDNLPFDLLEWRHGRWHEVRVAAGGDDDRLVELLVPAPPDVAAEADRLTARVPESGGVLGGAAEVGLADGARIPLQREAAEWLRRARAVLVAGRVILFDYADSTAGLARTPPDRWLRTFRQHQAALSPLEAPGSQDITCVVASDQLGPERDQSQADWLEEHGVEDLVARAREQWRREAAVGGLAALTARSRVVEAAALNDPAGLGGHRVLQWATGLRA